MVGFQNDPRLKHPLSFLTNLSYITVQRDLETLARQQFESKQRLEEAKKLKQKRAERHAALEAQLGELKYQVGQERAELQRRHKLLSEGARLLGEARHAGGKAGDDLRELDRYVHAQHAQMTLDVCPT